MCTVTFLPTEDQQFILTTNRDEFLVRANTLFPVTEVINGEEVVFPRDGKAGGTWVATSAAGRTACLLNGALVYHESQPPYRHSRGQVVLDCFRYDTAPDFLQHYDLHNIEPFTLIIADTTAELALYELKWDGTTKHITQRDETQPHIWLAVMAYSPQGIADRTQRFSEWLRTQASYDVKAVQQFQHSDKKQGANADPSASEIDATQTISVTSIQSMLGATRIDYHDLVYDALHTYDLVHSSVG